MSVPAVVLAVLCAASVCDVSAPRALAAPAGAGSAGGGSRGASSETSADASGDASGDASPDAPFAPPTEPLSFGFLDDMPGEFVSIGAARLHLHCRASGSGDTAGPTIVFEAGLGGSAFEWEPLAVALAARVRVCTYDRAGYGWSDPSRPSRHARRLADELDRLLDAAALPGPVVLVAHSFGGFVARLLAGQRRDIGALVLLDTSHELQFARFERPGERPLVPSSRQFVIARNEPPANLPLALRRKVAAFGRMRKTYNATHGEMAAFRESAAQVQAARARRGGPFPFPVTVVRRGRDLYAGRANGAERTATWNALQADLAALGAPGRLVVAEGSGHHLHVDDPGLVVAEIERVLDRLARPAR